MKAKILIATSIVLGLVLALIIGTVASGAPIGESQLYLPVTMKDYRSTGPWADSVTFVAEPSSDNAIASLENGDLDVYAYGIWDATTAQQVISSSLLDYDYGYGLNYELTLNPSGPEFVNGRLNPFSNAHIREALNWLIDREYIVHDIFDGRAEARWHPSGPVSTDRARMADVAHTLELEYSYNPIRANQVISAEMQILGAQRQSGIWYYDGAPVTLIFLIRNDSDGNRIPMGDYIADQLESVGFSVERRYLTSSQASPLWVGGNPADGLWHLYTGAWSQTIIDRDTDDNFGFFYMPFSAYGFSPLWQAYKPAPEFYDVAEKLYDKDYSSLEERQGLYARALELAIQDSARVWLADRKDLYARRPNITVASDVAGGLPGSWLWPLTLQRNGQSGGAFTIGQPDLLVDPWNPVDGSNWQYDTVAQRGTSSSGTIPDPYSGLALPQRIERAEVTVKAGLPVTKTLDWVSLNFAPEIQVPSDAWVDWDATSKTFVTAEMKYTTPITANVKSVVYYPVNLFSAVKWHDGSPISVGDFVMNMIMIFDRAKPESPIYDESRVSNLDAFMSTFKGFRITSTDPLVIEYYTDAYQLDAELDVTTLWPQYGYSYGEAAWHSVAMGVLAETNHELAFSADKADILQIGWMDYVNGASLPILNNYLALAAAQNYIPYAPTMGAFVTTAEAQQRWANYQAWYAEYGHFWIGTGPFYLAQADVNAKTLALQQFQGYPDPINRWENFSDVPIAAVNITGPVSMTIGAAATFSVTVTFAGEPYAVEDIADVWAMVYDEQNTLVYITTAAALEAGLWQVTLDADVTNVMAAGSYRLDVVVASERVVIPSDASYDFTVIP